MPAVSARRRTEDTAQHADRMPPEITTLQLAEKHIDVERNGGFFMLGE